MLRRTAPRKHISNFDFGHPDLTSSFGGHVYVKPKRPPTDKGIQETILPNGMRCVSHDRGGPHSTIGYYIDAGAKYDPISAPGLSYVMRWALPTSNMHNSLFQIDRAMRSVGAGYGSDEVNKKHIGITASVMRDYWRIPLDEYQACLAVPRFLEADIERFRDTMDNLWEETRWQKPREYCIDQLETIAFFKEPLGRPRHVPADGNDACSSDVLLKHYCEFVQPARTTLVGLNVAHDELVAATQNATFKHTAAAPHHERCNRTPKLEQDQEAKQYCPGKYHYEVERRAIVMCSKPDMDEEAIFALGWPTYGCESGVKRYATALVAAETLNVAIGDGINWNRSPVHQGLRAFYRPYSSVGLFGLTGRNSPDGIVAEAQAAAKMLRNPSSDITAAKARAETAFLQDRLETEKDYLGFLATTKYTAEEVVEAVRSTKLEDVNTLLAASRESVPCLYATGSTDHLPSMKQLGLI